MDTLDRVLSTAPAAELHMRPRRRRWMPIVFALVAGALVATVLGLLVDDHVSEDRHFDRLHASFMFTRHNARDEAAQLADLRHTVAALRSQVNSDSATWSQDTAELKVAYAALVLTQADVSQQGSRITDLHTCLGGVRQALNLLAINDPSDGYASLESVASSCAAESAS